MSMMKILEEHHEELTRIAREEPHRLIGRCVALSSRDGSTKRVARLTEIILMNWGEEEGEFVMFQVGSNIVRLTWQGQNSGQWEITHVENSWNGDWLFGPLVSLQECDDTGSMTLVVE